jgi:hypothetical protein
VDFIPTDITAADLVIIGLLVILEGLLSADNALVLAILVLGLPKKQQKQALRYGILGAFFFRIMATLAGRGGLPSLALVQALLGRPGPPRAPYAAQGDTVDGVERVLGDGGQGRAHRHRVRDRLDPRGRGIIMMRLVIGQLLVLVQRYPALVDGAFIIIAWVGIKLFLEYAHEVHWVAFVVPKWFSLGLIVLIFVVAFLYARREGPAPLEERIDDDAAKLIQETTEEQQ